jgi:hypothetical protein
MKAPAQLYYDSGRAADLRVLALIRGHTVDSVNIRYFHNRQFIVYKYTYTIAHTVPTARAYLVYFSLRPFTHAR